MALLAAAWADPGALAGPRDEDLFIRPEDQRTVLFGSLDAGRSTFVSGGLKQSLVASLDREGFVVMETSGYGLTRERVGSSGASVPITRLVTDASVLGGYQWSLGSAYVAAFVGPEGHWEQVAVAGRLRRAEDPVAGARAQLEMWANPTSDTMLAGTVVAGSARSSVWARGAAGVRVFDKAFIGPEVTVYATPTYNELRWGAHLTGVALGWLNLRLSAGVMRDDAHRGLAPYGSFGAWIRL